MVGLVLGQLLIYAVVMGQWTANQSAMFKPTERAASSSSQASLYIYNLSVLLTLALEPLLAARKYQQSQLQGQEIIKGEVSNIN